MRQRDVTILDSINEGVVTVDLDWRITAFNKAAERIIGVSRELAIGKPCSDVFRTDICETNCALRRTTTSGQPPEPHKGNRKDAARDVGTDVSTLYPNIRDLRIESRQIAGWGWRR